MIELPENCICGIHKKNDPRLKSGFNYSRRFKIGCPIHDKSLLSVTLLQNCKEAQQNGRNES